MSDLINRQTAIDACNEICRVDDVIASLPNAQPDEWIRDHAVSARYVHDWYILCASENCNPVWTDEHIKELCRDFYLIPKEALPEPPEVEVINDEM